MSLRLQYSLRQSLAILLFGLPLLALEQLLSRTVSQEQVEFIPTLTVWLTAPVLIMISVVTFVRAYERFEQEFQPPLESTVLVRHFLRGLLVLAGIGVVVLGSSGWPLNEYHWARFGIIASGLYFGWLLAKWVYFDWLERARTYPGPPDDGPGAPVISNSPPPARSSTSTILLRSLH